MRNPKEEKTIKEIAKIQKVLQKHNIFFWLDLGALLGLIRENQLLAWDTDVDFFSLKKDTDRKDLIAACKELEKEGFEVCQFWDKQTITTRKKDCLHINLHFLDIEGEYAYYTQYKTYNFTGKFFSFLWWMLTSAQYGFKQESKIIVQTFAKIIRRRGHQFQQGPFPLWIYTFPIYVMVGGLAFVPYKKKIKKKVWEISKKYNKIIKWKFPLDHYKKFKEVSFYNLKMYIPSNVEKHLIYYFGKDWKVPKYGDTWDETKDNPTVTNGITEYNLPKEK